MCYTMGINYVCLWMVALFWLGISFAPSALAQQPLALLPVGNNAVSNQLFLEKTISGTVTDAADGTFLPGVNVVVKGTTTGTVTDIDGNYNLTVSDDAQTLVFSSVGYVSREVAIDNRSVVDIALEADVTSLEEVVVVGYGTQKKADITGAIATMDAKQIEERPLARIDQALVGQMAGVRVVQASGLPGQGFSVQVRGTGSITANNQPLYVIDGFPLEVSEQNSGGGFSAGNPLDNINPNDIASIEVLKDAAAAAIYGSRASRRGAHYHQGRANGQTQNQLQYLCRME